MLVYVYKMIYCDSVCEEYEVETKLFSTKEGAYKALYADVYNRIEKQKQHRAERENAERLEQEVDNLKQKWIDYKEVNQVIIGINDDDCEGVSIWSHVDDYAYEFELLIVEVQE